MSNIQISSFIENGRKKENKKILETIKSFEWQIVIMTMTVIMIYNYDDDDDDGDDDDDDDLQWSTMMLIMMII